MAKSLEDAAEKGTAGAALGLGIAGTVLGLMGTHGGVGLLGTRQAAENDYVTKSELNYVQELAKKDSEIALLKSEQNTEIKIADVYERVMTRVNADKREQDAWNCQQMVNNAQISAAVATNSASICALRGIVDGITKFVVPADAVCPQPMLRYNSWTAPTDSTPAATVASASK